MHPRMALAFFISILPHWAIFSSQTGAMGNLEERQSRIAACRQLRNSESAPHTDSLVALEIVEPAMEAVLQSQSVSVSVRIRNFPRWGSVDVYLDEEWQAAGWEAESRIQLCVSPGHHVLRAVVRSSRSSKASEGEDDLAEAASLFEIEEKAAECPALGREGHCMWPWGVWDNSTVRHDIPFGIRRDRNWLKPAEHAAWFEEPIPGQTLTTETMAFVVGASSPLSVLISVSDFEARVAVGPDRTRTVYLPLRDGAHVARMRVEQEHVTDGPSIHFVLNRSAAAQTLLVSGAGSPAADRLSGAGRRSGGAGMEVEGKGQCRDSDGRCVGPGTEESVAFIIAGYVAKASERSSYGQRHTVSPILRLSVGNLRRLHPGCHILVVLNRYSAGEPSVAEALRDTLHVEVVENVVERSGSGYELGALRAAFRDGGLAGFGSYVLLQHTAWIEQPLPLRDFGCPFAALAPSHLPELCREWAPLDAYLEYQGEHLRQRDLLVRAMAELELDAGDWEPFCGALGNSFIARGPELEALIARGFPAVNITSKDLSFFGERLVGAVARSFGCEPCQSSVDLLRVHINYGGCADTGPGSGVDLPHRESISEVIGGACGSGERGVFFKFFAGRH